MTQSLTLTRRQLLTDSLALTVTGRIRAFTTMAPTPLDFTGRTEAEFQALLDRVPPGAVIVCKQAAPLVVRDSLVVRKPLTLRGQGRPPLPSQATPNPTDPPKTT